MANLSLQKKIDKLRAEHSDQTFTCEMLSEDIAEARDELDGDDLPGDEKAKVRAYLKVLMGKYSAMGCGRRK